MDDPGFSIAGLGDFIAPCKKEGSVGRTTDDEPSPTQAILQSEQRDLDTTGTNLTCDVEDKQELVLTQSLRASGRADGEADDCQGLPIDPSVLDEHTKNCRAGDSDSGHAQRDIVIASPLLPSPPSPPLPLPSPPPRVAVPVVNKAEHSRAIAMSEKTHTKVEPMSISNISGQADFINRLKAGQLVRENEMAMQSFSAGKGKRDLSARGHDGRQPRDNVSSKSSKQSKRGRGAGRAHNYSAVGRINRASDDNSDGKPVGKGKQSATDGGWLSPSYKPGWQQPITHLVLPEDYVGSTGNALQVDKVGAAAPHTHYHKLGAHKMAADENRVAITIDLMSDSPPSSAKKIDFQPLLPALPVWPLQS